MFYYFRLIFCFLLLQFAVFSQKDNVIYDQLHQPDPRIEVKLYHNRTIGLGSQLVGVQVRNLTDKKINVQLEFYALLTCGQKVSSKIGYGTGVTIKPFDTLKAGGWFDSENTSFDAGNRRNSECMKSLNKSKQLPDGKYTAIDQVGFNILSITEFTSTGTSANGMSSNTGSASANSGGTQTINSSGNPKKKSCPTYGFKLSNKPTPSCVSLEWWSLSTKTNMISSDGTFSQSQEPEAKSFIIEYKKQNDLVWKNVTHNNSGRNIRLLDNLDACTNYEVRLTTVCDNGTTSNPTTIIAFKTDCSKPNPFTIENITSKSAQLKWGIQSSNARYPCPADNSRIKGIEYKSPNGSWNETFCDSGSPCVLNALQSKTTYRVRARYKYPNNIYSEYTNEVSFTTK